MTDQEVLFSAPSLTLACPLPVQPTVTIVSGSNLPLANVFFHMFTFFLLLLLMTKIVAMSVWGGGVC